MSVRSIVRLVAMTLPALAIGLVAPTSASGGLVGQFAIGSSDFTQIPLGNTSLDGSIYAFNSTVNFTGTDRGSLSFTGNLSGREEGAGPDRLNLSLEFRNQDSMAHNVILLVSGFDYGLSSPSEMLLETTVGGSVINAGSGSGNSILFRSWLDAENNPLGRPESGSSGATERFPLSTMGEFNFTNTPHVVAATSPYSMTMRISVIVRPGAVIRYNAVTTATPIPEPNTLALALATLPLLGLGVWARRRGSPDSLADPGTPA